MKTTCFPGKPLFIMVYMIMLTASSLLAQEKTNTGVPILKVYWNFHHSLRKDDPEAAFEIKRVYLGYRHYFNTRLKAEVKLDIGSPEDLSEYSLMRRYAYFKTAGLSYTAGRLELKVGLVDMQTFKVQEDFWDHRYVYKSMQDEHKFGNTADIGIIAFYALSEHLSVDLSVTNGEGYRNLQADDYFKYSAGISYRPVDILLTRVYYDIMNHPGANQSTFNVFSGLTIREYKLGLEYNLVNNWDYFAGKQLTGISVYGMYQLSPQFELFGRFDRLSSNKIGNEEIPWHLSRDGSALIGGVAFVPMEHVQISLNYKDWVPFAANLDHQAFIYLNLEFKY